MALLDLKLFYFKRFRPMKFLKKKRQLKPKHRVMDIKIDNFKPQNTANTDTSTLNVS